jgi:hypothetical protein
MEVMSNRGKAAGAHRVIRIRSSAITVIRRNEKLFDVLAEGLIYRNCRDDRAAIQHWIGGIQNRGIRLRGILSVQLPVRA